VASGSLGVAGALHRLVIDDDCAGHRVPRRVRRPIRPTEVAGSCRGQSSTCSPHRPVSPTSRRTTSSRPKHFDTTPALDNGGWHDSSRFPVEIDNPLNGNVYMPIYFNRGQAIHGANYVPPEQRSKGCAACSLASRPAARMARPRIHHRGHMVGGSNRRHRDRSGRLPARRLIRLSAGSVAAMQVEQAGFESFDRRIV
jgi:hypothetical protein